MVPVAGSQRSASHVCAAPSTSQPCHIVSCQQCSSPSHVSHSQSSAWSRNRQRGGSGGVWSATQTQLPSCGAYWPAGHRSTVSPMASGEPLKHVVPVARSVAFLVAFPGPGSPSLPGQASSQHSCQQCAEQQSSVRGLCHQSQLHWPHEA